MKFIIVVAHDLNRGIGFGNDLPWHLPSEMRWLYRMTTKVHEQGKSNAVLMGRRTWDSIPLARKPLIKRVNVVLSRTGYIPRHGETIFRKLDEAIETIEKRQEVETCFVLGGAHVYSACLQSGIVDEVLETEIQERFIVDTWMPPLPPEFVLHCCERLSLDGVPVIRRTFRRARGG